MPVKFLTLSSTLSFTAVPLVCCGRAALLPCFASRRFFAPLPAVLAARRSEPGRCDGADVKRVWTCSQGAHSSRRVGPVPCTAAG